MMKRLSLILILLSLAVVQQVHAQYYSVNYDARTVAAMATAFGTEAVAESYYREQVDDILKHYNAAEVATAGIFASKPAYSSSSWSIKPFPTSVSGIAVQKITTTAAFTAWSRRKSCRRYGWWRN